MEAGKYGDVGGIAKLGKVVDESRRKYRFLENLIIFLKV